MLDGQANKYIATLISLNGKKFTVLTIGNGSQIDIREIMDEVLPKGFWIDLQFKLEQVMGIKILGMELRPSDLRRPEYRNIVHVIHKSHDSDVELAELAEEIRELEKIYQHVH